MTDLDKPSQQLPKRPKRLMDIGSEDDEEQDVDITNINATRPRDAAPVPSSILERFGNNIGDIWWYAKGRNGPDGDPTIGIEVAGLRKTFGGYVWNEWWYFQKSVHENEGEEPPDCYVYRKRKVPDPNDPDEYEIVEEYVGVDWKDPDTGYDLPIPEELEHRPEDLCS